MTPLLVHEIEGTEREGLPEGEGLPEEEGLPKGLAVVWYDVLCATIKCYLVYVCFSRHFNVILQDTRSTPFALVLEMPTYHIKYMYSSASS